MAQPSGGRSCPPAVGHGDPTPVVWWPTAAYSPVFVTRPAEDLPKPIHFGYIWGPYFIALVGLLLAAAGIFGPEAAPVATAAVTLGGLLTVFGPVSLRLKGPIELSSTGFKGELADVEFSARASGEASRLIAKDKTELSGVSDEQVPVIKLVTDAMSNGWSVAHTSGSSSVSITTTYRGKVPLTRPGGRALNPGDVVTLDVSVKSPVGAASKEIVELVKAVSAAANS
jgi:hypothetical protein